MPAKPAPTPMRVIEKIQLKNFKRFPVLEASLNSEVNVLVGDNESGKSSILLALDLVLGGSRAKVEAIGLESLINNAVVRSFLTSERRVEELPTLSVEVYLAEQQDPDLNGANNSDNRICDGLRFVCEPNEELFGQISEILGQEEPNFPYEYYNVRFFTFSGKPYAAYNKTLRHVFLDSSQINNDYATRVYISDIYNTNLQGYEKNKNENEYRKHKRKFGENVLESLNDRLDKYSFALRTTGKTSLELDLTIEDEGIPIENRGKGKQSFIKTEFALSKSGRKVDIDILLLEEPENHLSHLNMKRLIQKIRDSSGKQLFIATHSDMISARLDLRRCLLLNSRSTEYASLGMITTETADFFMKAPDNNVLEFILSKKAILVEGDAEYILAEAFITNVTGQPMENFNAHVIAVGGTSFKRYLELTNILGIKTAVIRDNDKDFEGNCSQRYADYLGDNVQVFCDNDNEKRTFEISFYAGNREICDEMFGPGRKTLSVLDYMLKNKTECALRLLKEKKNVLITPAYFADAIQWINA